MYSNPIYCYVIIDSRHHYPSHKMVMVPFTLYGLNDAFWIGCRDRSSTGTACHILGWWGSKGRSFVVALSVPFLCCFLKPHSQQLPHLSPWHSSTLCGLGWGPPMFKEWCWLSWCSCVEHPWILVPSPSFVGNTRQLNIHDVLGQSSIRHYFMSSPVQLGQQHHYRDCWHSSLGKDLSVGDLVSPGNLHEGV